MPDTLDARTDFTNNVDKRPDPSGNGTIYTQWGINEHGTKVVVRSLRLADTIEGDEVSAIECDTPEDLEFRDDLNPLHPKNLSGDELLWNFAAHYISGAQGCEMDNITSRELSKAIIDLMTRAGQLSLEGVGP
jgi:hypothetical protein